MSEQVRVVSSLERFSSLYQASNVTNDLNVSLLNVVFLIVRCQSH